MRVGLFEFFCCYITLRPLIYILHEIRGKNNVEKYLDVAVPQEQFSSLFVLFVFPFVIIFRFVFFTLFC